MAAASLDLPTFSLEEVAQHNNASSLWVVISGRVYDVTRYYRRHPGGAAILLSHAGQDATKVAKAAHKTALPRSLMPEFLIGFLEKPGGAEQPPASGIFQGLRSMSVASWETSGSSRLGAPVEDMIAGVGVSGETDVYEPRRLEGEAALGEITLLLLHRLHTEHRLAKWAGATDWDNVSLLLRRLLTPAFNGKVWPPIIVEEELVLGPPYLDFTLVVSTLLEESTNLGEDPLVSVLEELLEVMSKGGNFGMAKFFLRLQEAARALGGEAPPPVAPEPPREAEPEVVSPVDIEIPAEEVLPPPDMPREAIATNLAATDEDEIKVQSLDDLILLKNEVLAVQAAWDAFLESQGSAQAAGETVYSAVFESVPTLQNLFTTPRAVQSMRFIAALGGFIQVVGDPRKLKAQVEALGFGHLNLEVTPPRVVVFRDAILELLNMELGDSLTLDAIQGFRALLNYIGGAIIYVRIHYSQRLAVLASSWAAANDAEANKRRFARKGRHEEEEEENKADSALPGGALPEAAEAAGGDQSHRSTWQRLKHLGGHFKPGTATTSMSDPAEVKAASKDEMGQDSVPTTFFEMFEFNAAVMGFANEVWMWEVLSSFDNIVKNASNPSRMLEECEVLCLRIGLRVGHSANINLGSFRSCMLASLRSMLPKAWDSSHEVAWTWLWENIERLLQKTLGKPGKWEQDLQTLVASTSEEDKAEIRIMLYERFFQMAPSGQDYFKQSATRLQFIADKVLELSLEMYKDPWGMVETISALGLRHVGYGIPTELIGPFVTVYIQLVSEKAKDQETVESFRWSIGLIAKMLMRVIQEGSTIVMKAINVNSVKMLKKAISCAPRQSRAEWLLNVQVGTQAISPLEWAVESGNLQVADAIIKDLLTIRADRERYYFGVDELFKRHLDMMKRLCDTAPTLIPTLLERLIWRSRRTQHGFRRVNYYVKHLLVNQEGNMADAMASLVSIKDQKNISHPVIVLISDTVWMGVVRREFILAKLGFLLNLLTFLLSQVILPKLDTVPSSYGLRMIIFLMRIFAYTFSLTRLLVNHGRRSWAAIREGKIIRVFRVLPLPAYLADSDEIMSLLMILFLTLMCVSEPYFWCPTSSPTWPEERCDAAVDIGYMYRIVAMLAMVILWIMMVDMAVFSTKLAAFVLVCQHIFTEVGRFFVAMVFLLITFASAIACLRNVNPEFSTLERAANCLFAFTVGIYEVDYRFFTDSPALMTALLVHIMLASILLTNILIAQLNCSYDFVYADMIGFARLSRVQLIVETLEVTPPNRWKRFIAGLHFDQRLEFDEGDVGMAGGLSVREPASLNPVLVDSIKRYGGSCSPEMQWPEDKEEEDKFERVERLVQVAVKRASRLKGGGDTTTGSRMTASSGGSQGSVKDDAASGKDRRSSRHESAQGSSIKQFEEEESSDTASES